MATQPVSGINQTITLPEGQSTALSFATSDIKGMQLGEGGALVVTLNDGHTLTISNFSSLASHGDTLSLQDGATVDAHQLMETLAASAPAGNQAQVDNSGSQAALQPQGPIGHTGFQYAVPGLINIVEPPAGQKVTYDLAPGEKYNLAFDPVHAGAHAHIANGALIITFGDQGEVILKNLGGVANEPASDQPQIAYNGKEEPLSDFLNELHVGGTQTAQNDNNNLDQIAQQLAGEQPGAGPAPFGAAGGSADFGSVIDAAPFNGIPPQGPIAHTPFNYGTPDYQLPIYPFFGDAPSISVGGGPLVGPAEGNNGISEPDVVVKENSFLVVPISADLGANASPNDVLTVTVTGIPGANIGTFSAASGTYNAATGTWTITLPPGQNLNTTFTFTPAHDSDYDFGNLHAVASQYDPATGATLTANTNFYVTTDAVAQAPDIATQNAAEEAGHTTPLSVNVHEVDPSGTETITNIKISGLPAGATLNHGTLNPDGSYTLTQAELTGLTVSSTKATTPGDYVLTVSATSTDTNLHGKEVDYSDNVATSTQTLNLTITPNSIPVITSTGITPGGDDIYEHNLTPTTSVTDQVIVNYGTDGAGAPGVTANGTFSDSGAAHLTENGQAVTVTETGNTYTGTADGHTVFTLAVASDGHYTFTLDGPLDNSNGAPIALNFGVTATDNDGDTASSTITINDIDDVPVAHNDINDFFASTGVATGNVISGAGDVNTGGADTLSHDGNNHITQIAFGSTVVNITEGSSATIDGKYGDLTINSNGSYTYTLDQNGVAGGGSGTTTNTPHTFTGNAFPTDLAEGQPLSTADQAALGELHSNMAISANTNVSGEITFDGGGYNNSLGEFTISSNGTLQAVQMVDSNINSGEGTSPNVNFNIGASSGATELGFFMVANGANVNNNYAGINFSTGSLAFVYDYGQADQHAATINDSGSHVSLVYTSATGQSQVLAGDIYFTSDRGGSNSLNADGVVHTISGVDSADSTGQTLQIGFEDLNGGGDKDYNDTEFTVKLTDTTTTPPATGPDQFTYTLTDNDGSSSQATLSFNGEGAPTISVNGGPPATTGSVGISEPDVVVKENSSVTVPVTAALGAGAPAGDYLTVVVSGIPSGLGTVSAPGGVYDAAHGTLTFTLAPGQNLNSGITFTPAHDSDYDFGNLTATVTQHDPASGTSQTADVNFYVTTDAVAQAPEVAAQNATEEAGHTTALNLNVSELDPSGTESITSIKLSGLPAGVTLNHGTLNSDGSYTLSLADLTGLTVTSQKSTPTGEYTLTLSATSTDTNLHGKEVDYTDNTASASTTAHLTITPNSVPVITSTGVTPGGDDIYEHNLTPTTSVTDQVIVNYGTDGAGAAGVTANGTFSATGVSQLTEDGQAVTVTETGNTYTGTADGHTVFTLAVGADGHYNFTLDGALDNANGHPVALNFGVTATDSDGDTANGTITINDIDDAPVAHNDVNSTFANNLTASGNVVSGAGDSNTGGADYQSKDAPNHVTSVSFDGHSVTVPTTGTATIDGKNGDLTIAADGSYTYTLNHAAGSTYDTDHVFTGNSFPALTEGVPISAADQADLGELHSNMAINANTQVSGTITFDGAAYANSLGEFTIGANGQLQAVQMIDSNIASGEGSSPNVNFSVGASANASELGFFLVANGGTLNNYSNIDLTHGSLAFVYDYGQSDQRTATINDSGGHVSLVYTGVTGQSEVLQGDVYFTTDRGGSNSLNSDGVVHTISGVDSADPTGHTLQIGFEDLPNGGDKDYNDTEFTVKLTDQTVACGCGDTFQYTLTDADGSSSTANLQLTCPTVAPTTAITVDAGATCQFVNQGGSLYLPLHVTTTGDGSQTLTTITVTGVGAEWTVGGGWTAVAGKAGEYQLALPAGTQTYNGTFDLIPTGNTTADESDLKFSATVSDNGQTATSAADINVGTLEAPVLDVPSSLTWKNYAWAPWSEALQISGSVTGAHEVINTITVNLNDTFTGLNPNNWSLADMGATLNEGTQTSKGVWVIDVNAADASSVLSGLKIDFPGGSWSNPADVAIHPNPTPDYHDTVIQVTETATETLSCGCTETVSVTHAVDVDFGLTPLVIDLTGQGFNLTTNANGVMFDMTGDGTKEQTSWIGAGTGLLCIDLNHNGVIDNANELFGKGFTSGFSILAQYDTNHDGVINASDAVFSQLMIWTDTNHDGISQASELHSLSYYGITSISLATTSTNEVIGDSIIGQTATVTYADGHTSLMGDAYFNVSDPQMAGEGIREDGTIGNDILVATASGNDVLAGHGGMDTLIGGGGADTFLFDAISPNYTATVENFSASKSTIDLSALLTQYNPLQSSIDNFVHATASNGNTVISVDASGSGKAADFVNVAVLQGVAGINIDELLAHHQLIAHAA